ncbi:unnamed protein product [Mycena citricolor]|uniref:Uncharacterized protein n=1 Tax=Mycena citricolor TaxID=2018698 RepID=A0AAD2Q5C7_9AGAR|nr:unnamed protein product [Mycena citricolor]
MIQLNHTRDVASPEVAALVAQRSAPMPISITEITGIVGGGDDARAPGMALALQTAARWRSVRIMVDRLGRMGQLPAATCRELVHLALVVHDPPTRAITTFGAAPLLKTVIVMEGRAVLAHLRLPYAQLVAVLLQDTSPCACLRALAACASLQHADITTKYAWDGPGPGPGDSSVSTLAQLQMLSLTFEANDDSELPDDPSGGFGALLAHFAFPALKSLKMEWVFWDWVFWDIDPGRLPALWPAAAFAAFQARSPNIDALSLTGLQVRSDEDFLDILRAAPALRMLELGPQGNASKDRVFAALVYDAGDASPPLLPALEEIEWDGNVEAYSARLFEQFVRSRWWSDDQAPADAPVSRLKSVCVPGGRTEMSPGFKDRMEALKAEGLSLDLDFSEYHLDN